MVDLLEQIENFKGNGKKEEKIQDKPESKKKMKLEIKQESKSNPKKHTTKDKKNDNLSGVVGHFGMNGTGKTYRSLLYASNYGKTLYITTELKVKKTLQKNEIFSELKYKIYNPKKVEEKGFKLNESTDIDIFFVEKVNSFFATDEVGSIGYFKRIQKILLPLINSNYYNVVVIDNCSILKEWSYVKWLDDHKGRERPNEFEWSDIQATIQECLLPYINICVRKDKFLILNYGITGDYIAKMEIGTKEDAKDWVLRFLEYELWFERDYKIYCLKHPYKPFWEYQDEDEDISKLLFSNDFVDNARYVPYIEFKEKVLMSEALRMQISNLHDEQLKINFKQ